MNTSAFQPFWRLSRFEQAATAWKIFRLQIQVIFSRRVVWFLGAIVVYMTALYLINYFVAPPNDRIPTEALYIMVMTMPLSVLSLYLNMQVIVTEKEQRTIEVMFTTAGSRYRVWLLRLGALNILLFLVSLGMSAIAFFTFTDFSIPGMACNVFATVFFIGNVTLFFAVRLRSGLGAGMVTALVVILHLFSAGVFDYADTRYFLLFNPYEIPGQMDPQTWDVWTWQNRIGTLVVGGLFLFFALRGMENRDRLLR
jgi:hypothetical protein